MATGSDQAPVQQVQQTGVFLKLFISRAREGLYGKGPFAALAALSPFEPRFCLDRGGSKEFKTVQNSVMGPPKGDSENLRRTGLCAPSHLKPAQEGPIDPLAAASVQLQIDLGDAYAVSPYPRVPANCWHL